MLSRSDKPSEAANLDLLVEEVAQAMRDAQAEGIEPVTLLERAIRKVERESSPPIVPILDQLVERSGWLKKACSG